MSELHSALSFHQKTLNTVTQQLYSLKAQCSKSKNVPEAQGCLTEAKCTRLQHLPSFILCTTTDIVFHL
ncbi:hypothetical protein COCON_G00121470 [Conger conger]|uniref:Uncharacterized protein n=1 Tax=Conger conger TaxID=82655 RepID=A0A9Q1DHT8_CONCO|nr:hypothetical protein COCON_G00121470 [Conger conger]